jgi:hypothetical protein
LSSASAAPPAKCRCRVSHRESCTVVVDKRFRTGPGCVSMWWRDGADIDPGGCRQADCRRVHLC